ncbi:carbonic anhydrase [Cristinia sonorae]|uniref:Carbonic anhydrase n=1 Tax=Cristinia sonorae TaxID=1940300 RepID=A0A8K0UEY5_9AGAR|nr:carbonic anhydrase [Cristinia sonorae]
MGPTYLIRRPFSFLFLLCVSWIVTGVFALSVPREQTRTLIRRVLGDPVLDTLLAQNVEWAEEMDVEHPGFFKESAKGHRPKVLWIGCSDSRVPESVITASLPGEIFTQRNIANQIPANDTNALAVISYAVEHLKVDRIVVAGHTHCGGVAYCYDHAAELPSPPPKPLPPLPEPVLNTWLGSLYQTAVQQVERTNTTREAGLAKLTATNVRNQVDSVVGMDVIRHAWKEGRDLKVVGWLYDIENGHLEDLGICVGPMGLPCLP